MWSCGQRCVLVALQAQPNRAVSVDQLVYRCGGSRPPQRPTDLPYSYVSRLRRALAPAAPVAAILRRGGGYRDAVNRAAVDVHRFTNLATRAGAASDEAL